MISKVLCLTSKEVFYGTGHYLRMLELQRYLYKHNIDMDIYIDKDYNSLNITSYKVVILDKRDDDFPDIILAHKNLYKIAIDNRGNGRTNANLSWDTLPHPKMTDMEFKTSLQKIIFTENFMKKKSKANQAKIIYHNLHPMINYKKSKITNKQNYTYFGQYFFEMIYQGKTIYLYNISLYHRYLSNYFITKWKGISHPLFYINGYGLNKLMLEIKKNI